MVIDYYILLPVFIIGILISYTDIKRGKIYNRHVIYGFILGILWSIFYGIVYVEGEETFLSKFPELGKNLSQYYLNVFFNFLISFILAFSLWWFNLWSSGDGKLFSLFSFLLPLGFYSKGYMKYFPSYVLFFNMFVSLFAVLILELFIKTLKQFFLKGLKWFDLKSISTRIKNNYKSFIKILLFFIFFFTAIRSGRMVLRDFFSINFHLNESVIYLILFFIFHPILKLMRQKILFFIIALCFTMEMIFLFFIWEKYHFSSLLHISGISVSVIVLRMIYDIYLKVMDYKEISLWDLKPKMILSEKTINILKEERDFFYNRFGDIPPDGISEEQVELVKRFFIDKRKGDSVFITPSLPFAPSIFLALILTVIFKGYIFRI